MTEDRKKPAARRGPGGPNTGKDRGPGRPAAGKPGFGKAPPRKAGPGKPGQDKSGQSRPDQGRPRPQGAPAADSGEAKPFRRQDGMKRAFAADGKPARPRPGKWERREAATEAGEERRPRGTSSPRDGERPRFDKSRADRPRPDRPSPGKPRFEGARPPRPGRREREETAPQAEGESERIARRLARAGVASRRDAEAMIASGRISLNGRVLDTPAVNVGPGDRIEIDGQPIPAIERTRLFLFHKPAGAVTTSRDPEGRRTVFDVLPAGLPRLMTVGRLDINTEGLLLLTNDGGLARVLELPATGWLRRYRVRVHGKVDPAALEGLKEGIAVDGVFYGAVEASLDREQGSNAWLTIGLREGKNREVKNILGALGLDVTRLIRVSYGPFQLGDLAEGELRELKGKYLRDQLGERLIEEAGANFDAPILNAFAGGEASPGPGPRPKRADRAEARPERRSDDRRDDRREDALGRLDTRKPFPGKSAHGKSAPGKSAEGKPSHGKPSHGGPRPGGFGKPGGAGKSAPREGRPEEKPRSRTANVWMAPGAKPMGEKKKAALEERGEGRRYAGKPRPAGRPSGKSPAKPGDKPRFSGKPSGKSGARPAGGSGPRKPRRPD